MLAPGLQLDKSSDVRAHDSVWNRGCYFLLVPVIHKTCLTRKKVVKFPGQIHSPPSEFIENRDPYKEWTKKDGTIHSNPFTVVHFPGVTFLPTRIFRKNKSSDVRAYDCSTKEGM